MMFSRYGNSENCDYIYLKFELVNSDLNAFKTALKAARYFENSRKKRCYEEFLKQVEKATWSIDGEYFATSVPIIYDSYEEYFIENLRKERVGLKLEVEKRIVPKYDLFTENTCIKISILKY